MQSKRPRFNPLILALALAAVLPQCAEAELLSLVDQIDSRMEIYREVLAPLKAGEFSQRVFALDNRRIYKHQ